MPWPSILELFNSDAKEIQSEVVAKSVESAVVLLGNTSSHISNLQRTKVLKEYNKDLVTWAQDCEGKFLKAAPQLFGPKFPKDATIHLEQVAALRKLDILCYHQFLQRPVIWVIRKDLFPATLAGTVLSANRSFKESPQQETE